MPTRVVGYGYRKGVRGCDCAECRNRRNRAGLFPGGTARAETNAPDLGIVEATPSRRTIRYGSDEYLMRRYTIVHPYIQFVIGLLPGEEKIFWDGLIYVFGSTAPLQSLDQPIFVLPFPNISGDGRVGCVKDMRAEGNDPESLLFDVVNSFWGTGFTYFGSTFLCRDGRHVRSMGDLTVGGISLYGRLKTDHKLSHIMTFEKSPEI